MRSLGLLTLLLVASVNAQVISTAETSGRGKTTFLGSVNGNRYAGVNGTGGYFWAGRGMTDSFDLFTIDGWSTVPGATQAWVGAGSNLRFAKLAGWDMSLYQYATTPVNRRGMASTLLYDACWINSRHVGPVVPYVGLNAVVPIGNRNQSAFTPPKTEYTLPIGLSVPSGKAFLYFEADVGKMMVFSAGVSLTR